MTTTDHLRHLGVVSGHIAYTLDGAGTPPVFLLHAGYVDHRMYARETRHLARRTTVVAPDARTHGASSTATTAFRHCDDIAALIRHLDRGPAVLLGTSMGGAAAVDVALEHPELVKALVVCGAGTNEPVFESTEALELLWRAEQAIAAQDVAAWLGATLAWAAGPDRALEEVDQDVVAFLAGMHQDFVSAHIRPGVVPPDHVTGSWERLTEITLPVLGVVGELDFVDHHRMTERLVASVPDGRGVVRIPGAGHFPNLEQPLAWERAVDDFLDDAL